MPGVTGAPVPWARTWTRRFASPGVSGEHRAPTSHGSSLRALLAVVCRAGAGGGAQLIVSHASRIDVSSRIERILEHRGCTEGGMPVATEVTPKEAGQKIALSAHFVSGS